MHARGGKMKRKLTLPLRLSLVCSVLPAVAGLATAASFVTEYKPPTPSQVGVAISIAVTDGTPHLIYNRGIDSNQHFRYAYLDSSDGWQFRTVFDVGSDVSDLAASGSALFASYRDLFNSDARFAHYNGTIWSTELIPALFPDEGRYNAIALDQFGTPHLSFHEGSGADNLMHAVRTSPNTWFFEVAAGAGTSDYQGRYSSIAVSSQDTVFISHVGISTGGVARVQLSELSNAAWESIDISPTLNAGGVIGTSIAVTASGSPVVAFVINTVLYYATRSSASSWSLTAVDTLGAATGPALVLDSSGQPHIVYRGDGALKHAYLDAGLGWRRETIDAPALGIGDLDMAIDVNDMLHIGYQVRVSYPTTIANAVYYASGTFGSWNSHRVEGADWEGSYLAMATTSAGAPIVAYYDERQGDVQVSQRIAGNSWIEDDIAESDDVGRYVALPSRVLSSNTADVVYWNASNGSIMRSVGFTDSWTTTTLVPNVLGLSSLSYADSAGFGRVAFYGGPSVGVRLVRLGPGPTSVEPVDLASGTGQGCRLGVTGDGVTHVVYYDALNTRLRHARFVAGAWAYTTIASGPGMGSVSALATDNSALGVAYYDPAAQDLRWATWTGSGWNGGLVDSVGSVGSFCSLAFQPGGVMAIAYYDATNSSLKFAALTNAGDIISIDTVDNGGVGRPNAIVIDPTSELAAIAYYDETLRQIKYAKQVPGGVGVEEWHPGTGKVTVSPNPARAGDTVRIAASGGGRRIRTATLFDARGREVTTAQTPAGSEAIVLKIPVDASGIMFVRVISERGAASTGRIVVVR
jgi:hypothetical protein